jgi:aminoglycoside phosphotransferase (APT) family kinase protein
MRRLDIPHRAAQTREKLKYLAEHRLFDPIDVLEAIVESIPSNYRPRADVLVHGDLYSRHLIVDDRGRVAGVIDWGDVHLGEPATDLMVAWAMLPPSARAEFFSAYGEVDALTWKLSRFRALNHTGNVIPYAHQTGDEPLLRECLRALTYLLE